VPEAVAQVKGVGESHDDDRRRDADPHGHTPNQCGRRCRGWTNRQRTVVVADLCDSHAWKDRPRSARRRRDDELLDHIRVIHEDSKATYGWPRIHPELRHRGVHVSRKRVARLMRATGLSGMIRRREGRTTTAYPAS